MSRTPRYRGRFAPSPTGALHFGSLLAALASWCDARAHDGEWLVRIEDVDLPRSRRGIGEGILATLEAYGFQWDGAVVWQSDRAALYEAALEGLRAQQRIYACVCSRKQLESAPLSAGGGERIYPGTCRGGSVTPSDHERRASRIIVTDEPIGFHDRLQGQQQQLLARDVGDFVVKRADGMFAYQLAVVVDDALQGVTDVVRGADLLASTPRQIWLQRALGYPTPRYLHIPIAVDRHGEKLSKQTGARPLPRDPLSTLCAAWRFLEQPPLAAPPASVTEFWQWAHRAWNPGALPPVAMLQAPRSPERLGV